MCNMPLDYRLFLRLCADKGIEPEECVRKYGFPKDTITHLKAGKGTTDEIMEAELRTFGLGKIIYYICLRDEPSEFIKTSTNEDISRFTSAERTFIEDLRCLTPEEQDTVYNALVMANISNKLNEANFTSLSAPARNILNKQLHNTSELISDITNLQP